MIFYLFFSNELVSFHLGSNGYMVALLLLSKGFVTAHKFKFRDNTVVRTELRPDGECRKDVFRSLN